MKNLLKVVKGSIAVAALVMLSACNTVPQNTNPTQINSQWLLNTATFEQKTITSLMVVALVDNPTNRRVLEDSLCNAFAFGGLPATPSYEFIEQAQQLLSSTNTVNMSALRVAAQKAKASDILLVRGMGQKTNLIYNPGMTWGPGPFWGPYGGAFGGPFGPDPFWGDGWAIPPSITQQQIANTNVELMLTNNGLLLWSASLSTLLDEESPQATYQKYAELVLQTLQKNGFLIPVSLPNYQPIQPANTFAPAR